MWWIIGITLLYFEYLSAGIAFLCRSEGERRWYLALVPIYGLKYLGRVAGVFTVLSVPVRKCLAFFAELMLVAVLCGLYWSWGVDNLTEKAYVLLGQIMILPIAICYALMYLAVIKATARICKRYGVRKLALAVLASLFLLPIPVIFYKIKDNAAMSLSEMYG